MITSHPERTPDTRDRLLDAGLRLFAARGFSAVSVGEIEREVGLAPRRGALYRHFASKAALLEAAVEEHLESVAAARTRFVAGPPTEPAEPVEPAEPAELARWVLAEMDRQRHITQVLERDGDRLPQVRDRFRERISETGYAALADVLRAGISGAGGALETDADALAVLLLGGLVNARRSAWTLGASPLGIDDDRMADAWAHLCRAVTGGA